MAATGHTEITQPAEPARLTLDELERALAAADSDALLVPARILRRVIRHAHRLPRLRLILPHSACYAVRRDALLEIVDQSELGLPAGAVLPACILLLPQPETEEFQNTPRAQLLARYWRLLFHGRVHLHLDRRRAAGDCDDAWLRDVQARAGRPQFAEIRAVLLQENLLAPDADDWESFVEFAATYLEIRHFAPGAVERWFPGLEPGGALIAAVAECVDAEQLLAATRLRGAESPADEPSFEDEVLGYLAEADDPRMAPPARRLSPAAAERLTARAERAADRGNLARACILLARARQHAPDRGVQRLRAAIRGHIARLVRSLQEALGFAESEAESWREVLPALVARSVDRWWSPEARLLFDLQKISIDHERRVYGVNVWRWVRSLGRGPLKRPLPCLADVLVYKRLRSAQARVAGVRVADHQRRVLADLLHRAAQRSERQLRDRLRPAVDRALAEAQLLPVNAVERVAARKLVEELLDRVLDRGFLAMGDLRDAIARNHLKARDLSGPQELFWGDQLLSADRRMSAALDGVYRRGESYLRVIQGCSSLAFGTATGRLLMRYLIIPFGGAYVVEAGIQHLIALCYKFFTGNAVVEEGVSAGLHHLPTVFLLGVFLLLLINVEHFREGTKRVLAAIGRGLRYAVSELPRQLLELEVVQRVVRSRAFRWTSRFFVKPLLVTGGLSWVLPSLVPRWQTTPLGTTLIFLGVNLLLNSRLGRDLEELTTDWLGRAWHWLGAQVIARLFWLIMDIFRAAVEATERLMYSVDEWLRFRSGEGRLALAAKATLGVFWFAVAYVARFCINLLIEPQINPIKHFPVVTVSHKVLLPFIPALAGVLEIAMERGFAITVATTVIATIPGIFGFLTWELRENWRLYAANRPKTLRPLLVGKHGETMRRLLLVGLHSGTLPKRYAKLRRADAQARLTGRWHGVRKHLQALADIELAVCRFVERDFLWLLAAAQAWRDCPWQVHAIRLMTTRMEIELRACDEPETSLELSFQGREKWILAAARGAPALERLSRERRQALAATIVGIYKGAGVDLVREEIEAQLPQPAPLYDADEDGLVVWPPAHSGLLVHYALTNGRYVQPALEGAAPPPELPVLDRRRVLFSRLEIGWTEWVAAWSELAGGSASPDAPDVIERLAHTTPAIRVLPGDDAAGN